eukprot:8183796-Pyramimonas_sp.AAC.1
MVRAVGARQRRPELVGRGRGDREWPPGGRGPRDPASGPIRGLRLGVRPGWGRWPARPPRWRTP